MTLSEKRYSRSRNVQPTFDSRVRGEPYEVEVRENGRRLSIRTMPDPFHNTTIRPRGLRVALAVLMRRYSVSVHVDAPRQLIEDVLELAEDVVAERDRLRAACRHVVEHCYCQPSGQHCDVCKPAALALLEERPRP